MSNKCLYTGSGLHIECIHDLNSYFQNDNKFIEFVFIDSLPRNEYGFDYYYRPIYHKDFVKNLIEKCKEYNFVLHDTIVFTEKYTEINVPYLESTLFLFINETTGQKLKYYISTSIPYDFHNNDMLKRDISSCTHLIISGYFPIYDVLDYLPKPVSVIGYSNTFFPKNVQEYKEHLYIDNELVVMALLNNDNKVFYNIYCANKNNGEIHLCDNYSHLLEILYQKED